MARAKRDDAVTGEGAFTCEKCGRKFTHGAWYAKHTLHCDGTTATSARTAVVDREMKDRVPAAAPARKRSKRKARPVSRPKAREQKRTPRAADVVAAVVAKAIRPAEMLTALRIEAAKIQTAIAAIEALG